VSELSPVAESILERFRSISRIPRRSKHETEIARWLTEWASAEGYRATGDDAGNVVVTVPASVGREKDPVTILQGHMDMVCEKSPDSDHDFDHDPIALRFDGDWLTAADTTLGADNGVAIAIAMQAANTLSHPPLELLFTADEETGLTGARRLDTSLISGRRLINLDSEDEGVATIGCAGGRDSVLNLPVGELSAVSEDAVDIFVTVSGLPGGHSGVDINKQSGNAIRLLARFLDALLRDAAAATELVGFGAVECGSARNAIPREAKIELLVSPSAVGRIEALGEAWRHAFALELGNPGVSVTASTATPHVPGPNRLASRESLARLVQLLLALPNGVQRISDEVPGLVETSCNLAVCMRGPSGIEVTTSQRSSVDSRIDEMSRRIEAIAMIAGAKFRSENSYPAWSPSASSPLLDRAKRHYHELFGVDIRIELVHAGLECAVIGSTIDDIDMLSIGPTIRGAHSPRERLFLPSLDPVWILLEALLS